MVRLFIENKQFTTQIQYVFDTLFFWLGIKYQYSNSLNEIEDQPDDVTILYCFQQVEPAELPEPMGPLIVIKESGRLFGNNYLKPGSVPLTVKRYSDTTEETSDIISIYNDGEPLTITKEKNAKFIQTNIDIISDIFFMLSRYEEAVRSDTIRRDNHDRFPAMESLAYKNHFLHRPIVNEHMELLWSWIVGLSPNCRRRRLWGDKTFAVCLSHDVDHILKNGTLFAALRHTMAVLIRLRNLKKAVQYLESYFQNLRDYTKDPYWTFKYLINCEKKHHFNSSFYFMALEPTDLDYRYHIQDVKVGKLIRDLEDDGCEIGYHGSLQSFNNKGILDSEINRLDNIIHKKPYGCRQHYLKFQAPVTWRNQAQAGILYDTTLSFAEHEGFRCGSCLPFKSFDIFENKVLELWEIPLLIMEGTLQSAMYRNCTPEEGLQSILQLIETVKKYSGVFTVLWHNSSFDYNWEGWKPVFESMVEYLGKSDCVGLSGREIIQSISSE